MGKCFMVMNELKIGGGEKQIRLNGHMVTVIMPKRKLSYEEGVQRIDRIIDEIKKKQKI